MPLFKVLLPAARWGRVGRSGGVQEVTGEASLLLLSAGSSHQKGCGEGEGVQKRAEEAQ